MIALVAKCRNVIVNWVLIYGKLGAPAMGVRAGTAWATVLAGGHGGVSVRTIVQRERAAAGLFETPMSIDPAWMRGCSPWAFLASQNHPRGRRLCGIDRARGNWRPSRSPPPDAIHIAACRSWSRSACRRPAPCG
jgi:hypothetical protein